MSSVHAPELRAEITPKRGYVKEAWIACWCGWNEEGGEEITWLEHGFNSGIFDRDAAIVKAALRLAEVPDETTRDDEQGICLYCDGGWEERPGPRGGKPRLVYTAGHAASCPLAQLRTAIHQSIVGDAA